MSAPITWFKYTQAPPCCMCGLEGEELRARGYDDILHWTAKEAKIPDCKDTRHKHHEQCAICDGCAQKLGLVW